MPHRPIAAVFCTILAGLPSTIDAAMTTDVSTQAQKLHADSIVIDTHADTTLRLLDPAFNLGIRHDDGGIDLPRMREGGLDALFFSIWIPGTVTGSEAVRQALAQIEAVHRQIRLHPNELALAKTADDVRHLQARKQLAALIGVEGGHMIGNDLANLERFFGLGVRYMTLTHSLNTEWADSSTDTAKHKGLSRFGEKVVAEMNRLGMIVDISHVSDETFYDVLALSRAPVIASHSSARTLCDVPRNMSDPMIKDLAAKGGLIQVNYNMGFLSQRFADAMRADSSRIENAIDAEAKRRCGDDEGCQLIEGEKLMHEQMTAGTLPPVDWTAIVEHIDHIAKLVGADHVGLGSDFDGAYMPIGMENAALLPKITEALLKKGYTDDAIRKILGGNLLRVMEQVEAIAKKPNAL